MGTYWYIVNRTKKQYLDPINFGCGRRFSEILGSTKILPALAVTLQAGYLHDLLWRGDHIEIVPDTGHDFFKIEDTYEEVSEKALAQAALWLKAR